MPSINRPNGGPANVATPEQPLPANRPAQPAAPSAAQTNPPGTFTPHVAPPPPLVVTSPASARPPPIMPARDVFPPVPGAKTELDYCVAVPPAVVQRYPKIFFNGGTVKSHLELETKWQVDLKDVDGMKAKLDQMVADPALVEKVLGKGWKVTPNTNYIKKPMDDKYNDDPSTLAYTRNHSAFRDRNVEGDRYNNINFKPDGGVPGPTVYDPVIRAEYDIDVNIEVRDNPALLAPFIGSGEHLDVFRFGPKVDPTKLQNVSDLSDVRAKYNFEHESGLRIEASLDNAHWEYLGGKDASGNPIVERFGQLEMEKEHAAFAGNAASGPHVAGAAPAAPTAPDDDPLAALRNLSGPIAMGGAPRIHTPDDTKSPALRQTPDYGQQLAFNHALGDFLYNGGTPKAGAQKNFTGFAQAAQKDPALKAKLGL